MNVDREEECRQNLGRAFQLIASGVAKFGSALGAMDHGGGAAVPQLESEGHDLIRAAFEVAPELDDLLPNLRDALNANLDLADRGFEIQNEMQAAKNKMR